MSDDPNKRGWESRGSSSAGSPEHVSKTRQPPAQTNRATQLTTRQGGPPPEIEPPHVHGPWRAYWDFDSQEYYYHNSRTNISTRNYQETQAASSSTANPVPIQRVEIRNTRRKPAKNPKTSKAKVEHITSPEAPGTPTFTPPSRYPDPMVWNTEDPYMPYWNEVRNNQNVKEHWNASNGLKSKTFVYYPSKTEIQQLWKANTRDVDAVKAWEVHFKVQAQELGRLQATSEEIKDAKLFVRSKCNLSSMREGLKKKLPLTAPVVEIMGIGVNDQSDARIRWVHERVFAEIVMAFYDATQGRKEKIVVNIMDNHAILRDKDGNGLFAEVEPQETNILDGMEKAGDHTFLVRRLRDPLPFHSIGPNTFVVILNGENPWRQILGDYWSWKNNGQGPAGIVCIPVNENVADSRDIRAENLVGYIKHGNYEEIEWILKEERMPKKQGQTYPRVHCLGPLSIYLKPNSNQATSIASAISANQPGPVIPTTSGDQYYQAQVPTPLLPQSHLPSASPYVDQDPPQQHTTQQYAPPGYVFQQNVSQPSQQYTPQQPQQHPLQQSHQPRTDQQSQLPSQFQYANVPQWQYHDSSQ